MRRKSNLRLQFLVILMPLLMSACFGVTDKHSVLVKSVPANLAFGNPPAEASIPAPVPTVIFTQLAGGGPVAVAPLPGFTYPPFVIPAGTPTGPCPTAGPGVFPADPATPDLEHQPIPGTYAVRGLWDNAINIPIPPPGTTTHVKVPFPVIPRVIHKPKPAGDPTNPDMFTFDVDNAFAFFPLDPKNTASFLSRASSSDVNQVAPQPPGGPGPVVLPSPAPSQPPQPPNVHPGTSIDGVFLMALNISLNGQQFTFKVPAGSVGVQLLQVPAANGLQWSSSFSDSVDGTSVSFKGGINPNADPNQTGRERIDACGEIVDTWRVEGTLKFSGPGIAISDGTDTDPEVMNFVTQYGGWMVADQHYWDHAVAGNTSNPTQNITADMSGSRFTSTLNHLTPGPLPK
ncbi:MAG: hypothetical protein ACYDGR_14680 [Candidatus Dormibacteria bacterium]